jgi:ATP synthase proteolipid subunit
MILASWGSAWGTWRAGLGVCQMGIDHPKGVIKNIVPIVMAGVLGIYGLIVSVIITQAITSPGGDGSNTYSVYNGYTHVSFGEKGYYSIVVSQMVQSSSPWPLFSFYNDSLLLVCAVVFRAWLLEVLLV